MIKIANIVELSGGGVTAGTYFRDGVKLVINEINAAAGILGKKVVATDMDTQTNPGVAKGLTQNAIDDAVFIYLNEEESARAHPQDTRTISASERAPA